MAKAQKTAKVEAVGPIEAGPPQRTWADSPGTYLTARSHIDAVDALAVECEARWGCDRLRLLVDAGMREKFDRQRYLMNQAIWHGSMEDVVVQSGRMVKAWRALDAAATVAGKAGLPAQVLETTLSDGKVVAIVPDNARAKLVMAEGRAVDVYTLDEIARLLEGYPGLAKIKAAFPGATVTEVRRRVNDPLEAIGDTVDSLDTYRGQTIPF